MGKKKSTLEVMVVSKNYKKFWKNKRVLVTGHTGFKGSWLVFWLNMLGAKVYGYALMPKYKAYCYEKLNIKKKLKGEKIENINNYKVLTKFIDKTKPQIIFHMAAQPLVREAYKNPIETLNTNIIGTANLLQASRNLKSLKCIINITTDKCYENIERENYSYKEEDKMGGHDIYSSSKGSAELVISSFRRSFYDDYKNCLISSVRAGNVIGGGDWSKDRLIPDIIRSIKLNKSIKIRYPDAIRPWQHVIEPLDGYMKLAYLSYTTQKSFLASAWNFGPEKKSCITVRKVLNIFKNYYKDRLTINMPLKKFNHEAKYLRLDVKKSKKFLNWEPKWSVNKSIKLTIDWYDALFNSNKNLEKLSVDQINDYTKL